MYVLEMADCSATGTVIDRAARAVLGAEQASTSKHVSNLVGHASLTNSAAMQPLAAVPDHLAIPGGGMMEATVPTYQKPMGSNNRNPPLQHNMHMQQPFHQADISALHEHHRRQQNNMMYYQHLQQQQHMHMHNNMMMMQQQQHHQAAVVARQHAMASARAKDAKTAATSENISSSRTDQPHIETWHEHLEDDFLQSLQDSNDDDIATLGHEGIVQGASLEELAAAWAQAESEYDQLQANHEDEEDLANLWSGGLPQEEVRPYEFQNKEEPEQDLDWMEEGLKKFQEGHLKEAIYSFEMELQRKNPNNSNAWRMLGRCHAENDMDAEAIKCLEAAVDRDPFNPESLLALGVSYVNELNYEKALENLKAWFTHNPKYAGMDLRNFQPTNPKRPEADTPFDEVKNLLLSALNFEPSDPQGEVNEVLGVIYNVSKEYDAAADAFRNALRSRPGDYQLWNKLGATLANGNRSGEALPNYQKAIGIKARYARAWLNMAISHSNLQDHDEAARCYLQTLSLNPSANHCWVSASSSPREIESRQSSILNQYSRLLFRHSN
jgi:peroxin-5